MNSSCPANDTVQITEVTRVTSITIRTSANARHKNGHFSPVFQAASTEIALSDNLTGTDYKLMFYILGSIDERNRCVLTSSTIAKRIKRTPQAIKKSINKLIDMKILCVDSEAPNAYKINDYLLNPRIAYKGNTKLLDMSGIPYPRYCIETIDSNDQDTNSIDTISFEDEK